MSVNIKEFNKSQKMTKNDFEIYHYKDKGAFEVELHHHDFYEIFFLISGEVTYSIESKHYMLIPGDILLINPKELHQPKIGQVKQPYERMVVWINKSYLESFSKHIDGISLCFDSIDSKHSNLVRMGTEKQHSILKLMNSILKEEEKNLYGSEIIRNCLMGQLLVEINRIVRDRPNIYNPQDKGSALANEVVTYINEHYNEKISLDDLAAKFYISKYHLSHEFNRVVGTSVYRYIIQKRLLIAKQMLLDRVSPTDVFQKCGFGDYANFYKAFKAEYGISPKEFMNELKKEYL